MRRSEAAKYARWSAATAVLLAGITGAVYLQRGWQRSVAKKHAPPPAPVNVERQSTALTFSKVEENRTVFTVEASKSTDFRGENASLLEDVKITVFGKTGQRHDVLHTQSCRYSRDKGSIACSGPVQIDLLSAADAANMQGLPESAASRALHVETKEVTFDRASGLASTDQPVMFRFPNGDGEAVGVEYKSEEGTLRLARSVRVKLRPTSEQKGKGAKTPEEVEIQGSQLNFARDSHLMELLGPAVAKTPNGELTAGEFQMLLDDDFHAKTLLAKPSSSSGRPQIALQSGGGKQTMSADSINASFAPEGWVQQISAVGTVQGDSQMKNTRGAWKANSAELGLRPKVNQPRELSLQGGVELRMEAVDGSEARELQTEALKISFREGKKKGEVQVERADTLAPGSLSWNERVPSGAGGFQQTKLKADRLTLSFGENGEAKKLDASGNVQTERQSPGKPLQTASANTGLIELAPRRGWTQMQLEGAVRLKEGERTAFADHAVFLRADQTATLTGRALVRDATTQTTAAKFTFSQKTGDVLAEKGVKSTDLSARSASLSLAQAPATVTADQLQANSQNGRAVYTGHARLWQGQSVMEADSIELQRESRSLTATGNVRAVFPQNKSTGTVDSGTKKGPTLWNVSSQKLTYWDKENQAHLEKDVVIQSSANRVRGGLMDLYFSRGSGDASQPPRTSAAAVGAQQLARAVATGGVIVEQGARRAAAERGEYTAADGKFVMSGGNPTIFDASSGTTTGHQLTFFLADDTIIVDSENGSRTLTKHRVE